ncbi:DUF2726 domain-containing protein [Klebsiella pneumoniae]|nr:DUF2726 domain-containing protein [Klebsiella pneumoniae]
MITSEHYNIRSKFNLKVTDFVILDQEMRVIAVVELDDRSLFLIDQSCQIDSL